MSPGAEPLELFPLIGDFFFPHKEEWPSTHVTPYPWMDERCRGTNTDHQALALFHMCPMVEFSIRKCAEDDIPIRWDRMLAQTCIGKLLDKHVHTKDVRSSQRMLCEIRTVDLA
jgi:hypothetical protein